jgi:hypothetical protein
MPPVSGVRIAGRLTANHKVATSVNWKQGEDVVITGAFANDEAKEIYGSWKEPKPYIRIVPHPTRDDRSGEAGPVPAAAIRVAGTASRRWPLLC